MTASRGYLIHAFGSPYVDYGTMAVTSALLLKKTMGSVEVALVTSNDTIDWVEGKHGRDLVRKAFDKTIVIEPDRGVNSRSMNDTRYSKFSTPYYNTGRSLSFDLTPFDETILIDCDYMVLDRSLESVWGSKEDLMINKTVRDLNNQVSPPGFDGRFNDLSIPLYWATAMYFRKTKRVKAFFDLWMFVRDNYGYYQDLYNFASTPYFRNDYAMSIAIHLMGGHMENEAVKPLPISENLTATEHDDMIDFVEGDAYFISEADQGDFKLHKVSTNVHVMNKRSMVRNHERIMSYARA